MLGTCAPRSNSREGKRHDLRIASICRLVGRSRLDALDWSRDSQGPMLDLCDADCGLFPRDLRSPRSSCHDGRLSADDRLVPRALLRSAADASLGRDRSSRRARLHRGLRSVHRGIRTFVHGRVCTFVHFVVRSDLHRGLRAYVHGGICSCRCGSIRHGLRAAVSASRADFLLRPDDRLQPGGVKPGGRNPTGSRGSACMCPCLCRLSRNHRGDPPDERCRAGGLRASRGASVLGMCQRFSGYRLRDACSRGGCTFIWAVHRSSGASFDGGADAVELSGEIGQRRESGGEPANHSRSRCGGRDRAASGSECFVRCTNAPEAQSRPHGKSADRRYSPGRLSSAGPDERGQCDC